MAPPERQPRDFAEEREAVLPPAETLFQKTAGGIVVALVTAIFLGLYNNWEADIRRDEVVNGLVRLTSMMEKEIDIVQEKTDARFSRLEQALSDLRVKVAELK